MALHMVVNICSVTLKSYVRGHVMTSVVKQCVIQMVTLTMVSDISTVISSDRNKAIKTRHKRKAVF